MPDLSFEFFPQPGGDLRGPMDQLARCRPVSYSVTTRQSDPMQEQTRDAVRLLRSTRPQYRVLPHLVLGPDPAQLRELIGDYLGMGVREFVAIRGDSFAGQGYRASYGRDMHGADLVAMIREIARQGGYPLPDLEVGCYPEGHPETPNWKDGLPHLLDKLARGAGTAITQLCYDADAILRLRDALAREAPQARLVPGLLPIVSLEHCLRVAKSCGAQVPPQLAERLAPLDKEAQAEAGAQLLGDICRRLVAEGVERLHFYAFNRARPSMMALEAAGMLPAEAELQAAAP